jgi:hypothetical protein
MSIQTPNQSFTINSVSYGTLTVTAIGSSNVDNLYSGLIGNIVSSDGNSNITVKIINVPVAGTIVCKATLPYEKTGGVDLSTYDDGTIYFEPQLVDNQLNGDMLISGIVTATFFKTSTGVTANSTGTVSIVAKDAEVSTANAGWMPIKKSDGVTVYIPYWA